VFAETSGIENATRLQEIWSGDSAGFADEAIASNSYDVENGDMFLPTAGACGNWVTQDGEAAAPNCVYLVRAEQRFGNGDGVFTQSEQRRASEALLLGPQRGQLHRGAAAFSGWAQFQRD
jgi:hypothetical protein